MDNVERARLGRWVYPVAIVGAVTISLGWAWGFTVDDALIPARYAHHLRIGEGYRFNAGGPVTDGVTPLGWAVLLAPFAARGAEGALAAAKWLGAVAVLAAMAWLAVDVARRARETGQPWVLSAGVLACASLPLAAWAVAGLETGLVTAIATTGVLCRERERHWLGTVMLGVSAGLRPELLPWVLVLSFARGPGARAGEPEQPAARPDVARFKRLALACAPFIVVALIRLAVFGRAAPLSAFAKAPDVTLGARYALACFLLTGPVVLVAPFAWRRVDAWAKWLVLSITVHLAAVAMAGGDWMPLSRLLVPILPTVALAASHLAVVARPWSTAMRTALALGGQLFVYAQVGTRAREVGSDRAALIAEVRHVLEDARVVATVDIGWVGAAAPHATVVDLAGVTDPEVAALLGGHTTRRIPPGFFERRGVQVIVLLLQRGTDVADPWTRSSFDRGVEVWISSMPEVAMQFHPRYVTRAGKLSYLVLEKRSAREARR